MIPAALVLLLTTAAAQEPERPRETLALVDQARALPPEFSADILLRLASSKLIGEARWKRELIEAAFTAGAHAQLPYRQTAHGLAVDSRANQEVAHNDLEILTLRTRAVDAMLAIDPQRAVAMFQDIVVPELPRLTCQDAATPDVAAYYETAARVFERGFNAKQRKEEWDIQYLRQRIATMESPAQVVPALKLLFAAQLTPVQRQELTAALAVTLDRVSGSDRVYAVTENLLVSSALPEWHESAMFVTALRAYIVRQVGGPRCSDTVKAGQLPPSVTGFNKLVSILDPTAQQYKPITADEAKPFKDDGTFKPQYPWHSARSKDVDQALRWLNHGNRNLSGDHRFWTLRERSTTEWNARFLDTMKLIEGWKEEEEESSEDYLFMVAQTYSALAALVPPGQARENLMGNYRVFLETHHAVTENRNLWFAQVNAMLKRARFAKDPAERAWILDGLSRSANPIISLYAKIEGLLS